MATTQTKAPKRHCGWSSKPGPDRLGLSRSNPSENTGNKPTGGERYFFATMSETLRDVAVRNSRERSNVLLLKLKEKPDD